MSEIVRVVANDYIRSNLESGWTARLDTPITPILTYDDWAHEAAATFRPVHNRAVETIGNVTVCQPTLNPENERGSVIDKDPSGFGVRPVLKIIPRRDADQCSNRGQCCHWWAQGGQRPRSAAAAAE